MIKKLGKIIVILGPTSSGKSNVAIRLAKKIDGEIISADSRQIYRGMDIGTGKIKPDQPSKVPQKFMDDKFYAGSRRKKPFISEGILHYGIDIISPHTNYNAAKFKKYADKIIINILNRGKVPIICGGTGFWIKTLVDNMVYPEVSPDWKLRNKLRNHSIEKLFKILKSLDPARAKSIDTKNPVRLIRAIEICKALGKVPSIKNGSLAPIMGAKLPRYTFLQIGISTPKEKLSEKIRARLKKRFSAGMISEVKKLHFKNKLSWKRLKSFGLGYSLIPEYLKDNIATKEELFEKIYFAEKNYAKRQMTWFQKNKRIIWLEKYNDIEKEVKNFLK